MSNLKEYVIDNVKLLLKSHSDQVSQKDITSLISGEIDIILEGCGIKVLDLNDSLDSGYYLYNLKDHWALYKVEDCEKTYLSDNIDLIINLLSYTYAGRFIYWADRTDLKLIQEYTKKIEELIKGA